jgi:hypothetical protein
MNESTLKSSQLNKLHQLKQKVRLISDDIKFLKLCKENKVFPNFIKINISIKSNITKQVLHNAKVNWLNLEIKSMYAKQSNFEIQAMELHLMITKNLNPLEFPIFQIHYDKILESIDFKHFHKSQKLAKKLEHLKQKSNLNIFLPQRTLQNQNQNLIQNLSSYTFTVDEMTLLNKGLSYNLKPKQELKTLFVDVETNLKWMSADKKTLIRSDILSTTNSNNFQNTKSYLPVPNNEYTLINSLKSKNVFYLKADKSNTIVIMDHNEYFNRVQTMIEEGPYYLLEKDPLNKYCLSLSSTLKECNNLIDKVLARKLTVSNPNIPRLYCLPKIHKEGKKK